MKFWEAMKALEERKKIFIFHPKAMGFGKFTLHSDGMLANGEGGKFGSVPFERDGWEIYEDPKTKIKLTPEHVGRKVRLKDGTITLITSCGPNIDLITVGGLSCSYDQRGVTVLGDEFSIVEILE